MLRSRASRVVSRAFASQSKVGKKDLIFAEHINFPKIRLENKTDIAKISEVVQRQLFYDELKDPHVENEWISDAVKRFSSSNMSLHDLEMTIESGLITFLLHVESRVASSVGQGFYTIGPCGEELLAVLALHMKNDDPSALHYRHVAVSVLRQLQQGRTAEEVILDRARGYTCSLLDPVTGGRHCAIGGTSTDFVVTSTLASQAPPAVGRALSIPLAHRLLQQQQKNSTDIDATYPLLSPSFPKDAVSFVSVGEGSTNNAHFLAALNLAEYSLYNKHKCPLVFVVSDNGMCISLKDKNWVQHGPLSRLRMQTIRADGADVLDLYSKAEEAVAHARSCGRPTVLLVRNLARRFGHAATDRQNAYLSADEIQGALDTNHLSNTIALARALGLYDGQDSSTIADRYSHLWTCTEKAFDQAVNEAKVTSRSDLNASISPPISIHQNQNNKAKEILSKTVYTAFMSEQEKLENINQALSYSNIAVKMCMTAAAAKTSTASPPSVPRLDTMRKHMTAVIDEALKGQTAAGDRVVYLGEDVRHGGYYLVTDGLYEKYPSRVHDFPPDETTLLGVAHGFSQQGFVPIVEIPYAKYLDCGADMFYEIAITYWLTNGRQRDGLVIRVQGFDRGKFGGNFHTHNSIHAPLGIDVVCYSNGADYVRGMRYALRQAALAGRIVMFIDSTDLLNRRHLGLLPDATGRKDDIWLTAYPTTTAESNDTNEVSEITFEDVILYNGDWVDSGRGAQLLQGDSYTNTAAMATPKKLLIVTYGNGLPNALQAMERLISSNHVEASQIAVVDCPYLSRPPKALLELLQGIQTTIAETGKREVKSPFESVVFADVCKEGPGMIFAGFAMELQKQNMLPHRSISTDSINNDSVSHYVGGWRVVGAQPTYNPLGQTLTFLSSEDIEENSLVLLQGERKE